MGTYTYDYGELKSAAKNAEKAANKCEKYADRIKKSITQKLSDLEMGSNSNTYNANYFAEQKIAKLGTRASGFKELAEKITAVRDKAKKTDNTVASYIKTESREFRKNHDMNVNVVIEFFTWLSISVDNSSEFIRRLKDGMQGIGNWIDAKKRGFKEWFELDGGKYILGTAVAAIALVIAAVLLCASAIPAFLTAAGVILAGTITGTTIWTMITATAGLVVAILAVVDSATKIFMNVEGLATNEQDPGWAYRQASIGSFSELLKKKVFDSKFGNQISMIASHSIEIVSIVAKTINIINIANSARNFFKNCKAEGVEKIFNKVRFKTKDGKVTFGTFKYGIRKLKQNIDIINKGFGKSTISQLTEYYQPDSKGWKALKSMQKIMNASYTVADKGFGKYIVDTVKKKLKENSLGYNYGSKVKELVDTIIKTSGGWNYANPLAASGN